MSAKDHIAPATTDRFQRAGDEAERQMAFCQNRAFADDPGVHVFHNLLEAGGDAAQIEPLRCSTAAARSLSLYRFRAVEVERRVVVSRFWSKWSATLSESSINR